MPNNPSKFISLMLRIFDLHELAQSSFSILQFDTVYKACETVFFFLYLLLREIFSKVRTSTIHLEDA